MIINELEHILCVISVKTQHNFIINDLFKLIFGKNE